MLISPCEVAFQRTPFFVDTLSLIEPSSGTGMRPLGQLGPALGLDLVCLSVRCPVQGSQPKSVAP